MSSVVKSNLCFLQLLVKTQSNLQVKALLYTATKSQVKCLMEIAFNIIDLSVPVPKLQRKKLLKNIDVLKQKVN